MCVKFRIQTVAFAVGMVVTFLCPSHSWAKVRIVGIDPVNGVVAVKNMYSDTQDLSKFWISYGGQEVSLASMKLESGAIKCPKNQFAYFSGFSLGFDSGYLALFDLRYNQQISTPASLVDYVQWGSTGNMWSLRADTTLISGGQKVWPKDSLLTTPPPFMFTGGEADRGKKFWQSFKLPQLGLRFVALCPGKDVFAIKNTGSSNLDLGKLMVCAGNTCTDSLKLAPMQAVKGSLEIARNDTTWFSGLPMPDSAGNLSLFVPLNRHDTLNLIDYVAWGSHSSGYGRLAHWLKWWDTTATVAIGSGDTLWYTGNFARSPLSPAYWLVIKDSVGDTSHADTTGMLSATFNTHKVWYAAGSVFWENAAENAATRLTIYDPKGRQLWRETLATGKYQLPFWAPPGVYFLVIETMRGKACGKFWVY